MMTIDRQSYCWQSKTELYLDINHEIEIILMRGDYYFQTGDYFPALECYKFAAQKDRECCDAWIGMGAVYLVWEQILEAQMVFQKAFSINPNSERTALGLALTNFMSAIPNRKKDTFDFGSIEN